MTWEVRSHSQWSEQICDTMLANLNIIFLGRWRTFYLHTRIWVELSRGITGRLHTFIIIIALDFVTIIVVKAWIMADYISVEACVNYALFIK